ncbi:MAG TPA: enoyl-CoA hydratase/isomerase family protein, partial [Limnochordales bacterium]
METLQVEIRDGIATVWLNRPQVKNAINFQMCRELIDTFAGLGDDPQVRVVLLRSGLRDVFCAGADFKERRDFSIDDMRRRRTIARRAYEAISRCDHPVIAVVLGKA